MLDESYDTIVIGDGPGDNTAEMARKYSQVVELPYNIGIGGAVQTGFRYAHQNNYDFCIQIDGDGQHIPSEIIKLLQYQRQTNHDITIGSRFLNKVSFQSTWARRFGSRVISTVMNLLFVNCHITDPTSGMRLMNRDAIRIFSKHYPLDFPEPVSLAWALELKMSIGETSVRMRPREYGESSISTLKSFSYMFRVLGSILLCKIMPQVIE